MSETNLDRFNGHFHIDESICYDNNLLCNSEYSIDSLYPRCPTSRKLSRKLSTASLETATYYTTNTDSDSDIHQHNDSESQSDLTKNPLCNVASNVSESKHSPVANQNTSIMIEMTPIDSHLPVESIEKYSSNAEVMEDFKPTISKSTLFHFICNLSFSPFFRGLSGGIVLILNVNAACLYLLGNDPRCLMTLSLIVVATTASIAIAQCILCFFGSFPMAIVCPAFEILPFLLPLLASYRNTNIDVDTIYSAFVITLMIISIVSALNMILIGYFRVVKVTEYIPYPLIAGFFAVVGLHLSRNAINMSAGLVSESTLNSFQCFSVFQAIYAIPGVTLAIIIIFLRNANIIEAHCLFVGLVLAFIFSFYIILLSTWGWSWSSIDQAQQPLSWLSPPSTRYYLWDVFTSLTVRGLSFNYGMLEIIAAIIISLEFAISVGSSLNYLERSQSEFIQYDREYCVIGTSRALSSPFGGLMFNFTQQSMIVNPSFPKSPSSKIIFLTGYLIPILPVIFGCSNLCYYIPKFISTALVLSVGAEWIYERMICTIRQLSLTNSFIVWGIAIASVFLGVVYSIIIGLAAACVLFTVTYSRLDVIRQTLNGALHRSNVSRSSDLETILDKEGGRIQIFQLHGFIFFGTGNDIVKRVGQTKKRNPEVLFVLLDFRLVTGLDSSAVSCFVKLKRVAFDQKLLIVLTDVDASIVNRMKIGDCDEEPGVLELFEDMDQGLEFLEERILYIASLQTRPSVNDRRHRSIRSNNIHTKSSSKNICVNDRIEIGNVDDEINNISDVDKDVFTNNFRPISPNFRKSSSYKPESFANISAGYQNLIKLMPQYFRRINLYENEIVYSEGESGDSMVFLDTGRMTVWKRSKSAESSSNEGKVKRLRSYGSGSIVGEMGLLTGLKRSADVITDTPCIFYYLDKANLNRMEIESITCFLEFQLFIMNNLGQRLDHSNAKVKQLMLAHHRKRKQSIEGQIKLYFCRLQKFIPKITNLIFCREKSVVDPEEDNHKISTDIEKGATTT